jgi:uncharacterized protein (DUF1800 family)
MLRLTSLLALTALTALAADAVSATAAARFLQQASWGPTSALVAEVQKNGFSKWIDDQIALDASQWSPIPDPSIDAKGNTSLRPGQDALFANAVNGKDQLRQRVAFALGQMWVVSGIKLKPEAMVPYLRLLQQDAFTTYDKIMYDVTLSPAMGHYLDMVNNNKPTAGDAANENYARELLQLFTIGLVQLDSYGRPMKDADGNPIATYNQDIIEGFARAFTGWTYAPKPAATASRFRNPVYWDGPMVAFENHHDQAGGKLLLNGYTLPRNQTAEQDLKDALANVFNHPNVGPFVCRQLIQRLAGSNPSDDYVHRVAAVFDSQPRGDIAAVVKAILLDPEARNGDEAGAWNQSTKLREPVLWIAALMRALDAHVASSNALTDAASKLGQRIYYPDTVFNYFLPGYEINISDNQTFNAPEFQLLGEASSIAAADFVNAAAFGKPGGVAINYNPYVDMLGTQPGAADISKVVDALNNAMMGGRMSAAMHDIIVAAAQQATTPKAMVQTAVYLIGSSWDFQVAR